MKIAKIGPATLPPGCDALLSVEQLQVALGVCKRTITGMISAGEFPPHDTRIGISRRWRVGTLNAWIDRRCNQPAKG